MSSTAPAPESAATENTRANCSVCRNKARFPARPTTLPAATQATLLGLSKTLYQTFAAEVKPLLPLHMFRDNGAHFGQKVVGTDELMRVLDAQFELQLACAMAEPPPEGLTRAALGFRLQLQHTEKREKLLAATKAHCARFEQLAAQHGVSAEQLCWEIEAAEATHTHDDN